MQKIINNNYSTIKNDSNNDYIQLKIKNNQNKNVFK
jgi:hypothetical protein